MKTINLLFFLENPVELNKECVKSITEFEANIKIIGDNVIVSKKNGLSFLTHILDFKKNITIDDFSTLDFFPKNFLKEALLRHYIKKNIISKEIKVEENTGYIMESIISFPEESDYWEKYNEIMQEKAEIYFNL